jgi:transcriptional regulator with XRE-family HTH domain
MYNIVSHIRHIIMSSSIIKKNENEGINLSRNLTSILKIKKITVTELAKKLNIPYITIHRLIKGETPDPRVSTLKQIANYLSVPIESLFEEDHINYSSEVNSKNKTACIPIIKWSELLEIEKKTNTSSFYTVSLNSSEELSDKSFAITNIKSSQKKFPSNTILIIDPKINPTDGDIIIVKYLNEKNFISLRYLTIDPPKKFISALSNNNNDVDLLSTSNHKIIGTVFKSILQTYSRD